MKNAGRWIVFRRGVRGDRQRAGEEYRDPRIPFSRKNGRKHGIRYKKRNCSSRSPINAHPHSAHAQLRKRAIHVRTSR